MVTLCQTVCGGGFGNPIRVKQRSLFKRRHISSQHKASKMRPTNFIQVYKYIHFYTIESVIAETTPVTFLSVL